MSALAAAFQGRIGQATLRLAGADVLQSPRTGDVETSTVRSIHLHTGANMVKPTSILSADHRSGPVLQHPLAGTIAPATDDSGLGLAIGDGIAVVGMICAGVLGWLLLVNWIQQWIGQ
jgi:hypothetical protein